MLNDFLLASIYLMSHKVLFQLTAPKGKKDAGIAGHFHTADHFFVSINISVPNIYI